MNKRHKNIKVILGVLILLLLIQIPVYSFPGRSRHGSNYTVPEGISLENLDLTDGIYEGSADGFRPGLVVEIRIEGGELVSVEVVDHSEIGRQYYQPPINVIPGVIVDEQSTEIDSLAGATATSQAIKAAVEDAVQKAILQ